MLDAMAQVTGSPTAFGGYPAGTRALQLPDTQVKSDFLASFGRPAANPYATPRSVPAIPPISQALHVINGDTLNKKLSAPDGTIALFSKLGLSDRRILDHIFLSAYSRYPTDPERDTMLAALEKTRLVKRYGRGSPRRASTGHRDMVWALLTNKEFPVQPLMRSAILLASAILAAAAAPPKQQIYSMAWSPNGEIIALGGYKETRLVSALLATNRGDFARRGRTLFERSHFTGWKMARGRRRPAFA
jgi:hypothetical protein